MSFPFTRLRRLRQSPKIRDWVSETTLAPKNLIYPLFIRPGKNVRKPIASMPGQYQISVDRAVKEAKECKKLGIAAVILFGIPSKKDERGSEAFAEDGIIQKAIRSIKAKVPSLTVIADLCFCEYTSHGHCGIVQGKEVDNDATLDLIARTALAQARAGADVIAPSGMMDGMVKALRSALDRGGFKDTLIMAYSAKYASAFYGPFRDAAESPPKFGDRKSYQMDFRNAKEALREISQDLDEGADIVMVKPALAYLDVIRGVKDRFNVPVAAYNVSGEYAMVKAAAKAGWVDGEKIALEILTAIRRAGADFVLTYHAKDIAKILGR
ncbi:MAG: delta-aminolevulinic acid dehydratase [Elusimicrobia bacterium RIFCSPLOWO2_01_FULL_60_11]|nr:MAG: delta-aminolevulinic acid dehydratase [Elusimicrobia bacterium RIFCSPLOWO2_01_FULL_60_11]